MAEAYITTDHNELTPSPRLKDFEEELCFDQALECFYDPRSKTGVMCKFELRVQGRTEPILINFVKTSNPQLHAEQLFCKKANEGLQRNSRIYTPEAVSVTMLIVRALNVEKTCKHCSFHVVYPFISL